MQQGVLLTDRRRPTPQLSPPSLATLMFRAGARACSGRGPVGRRPDPD